MDAVQFASGLVFVLIGAVYLTGPERWFVRAGRGPKRSLRRVLGTLNVLLGGFFVLASLT